MSATIIMLTPGSEVYTVDGIASVIKVYYDKYNDLRVIVDRRGSIEEWYADELA